MEQPASSVRPRLRVAWVTHLASPYRRPVWASLSERWAIEVNVVESHLGRFGAENRGPDWQLRPLPRVRFIGLQTALVRFGRTPLHILIPGSPRSHLRNVDLLLLGGWESPVYWYFFVAARLRRRPIVGFYESTTHTRKFTTGPIAAFQRLMFRSMAAVVVPGSAAAAAVKSLGVHPQDIFEGFNAVDVERFREIADDARISQNGNSNKAPSTGQYFAYVGQLISRKRVDVLIKAVSEFPDLSLILVGEGVERARLESLAQELRCSDRVRFTGGLSNDEVPAVLAQCSTLCLVSEEEVWGLVVNEALAAGLQVLVAENCGVAASVRGMKGVFVVEQDLSNLPDSFRQAASEWNGEIRNPDILQYTPERFARTFEEAFQHARRVGHNH